MLRYMVQEKGMGWSACRKALSVSDDVIEQDVAALGLELENDAPVASSSELTPVEAQPERRRGRRLKDAEHLVEDLATMRSMQDQGAPLSDIAQLFGISVVTLKKRLSMTEAEVREHAGLA